MLWKIRKNLYKSDDVKFSQNVSTSAGRRERIRILRRTRIVAVGGVFLGFLMFALSMALIIGQSFLTTHTTHTTYSASDFLMLPVSVFGIANFSINYYNIDSQIKMLLLFEQTQPKG